MRCYTTHLVNGYDYKLSFYDNDYDDSYNYLYYYILGILEDNMRILYKDIDITNFLRDNIQYMKLDTVEIEKILELYIKNSSHFPEIFTDKNLMKVLL